MKKCFSILFLVSLSAFYSVSAQRTQQATFTVVPLGVKGGIDESNLSSYALAVHGTEEYVCLDAGTLNFGIQKAIAAGIATNAPPFK